MPFFKILKTPYIIEDLNDKFQEELEKNGYMITFNNLNYNIFFGNSFQTENAIIQIKKNEDTIDIGIFGGVDQENIDIIKQSEKEFEHLKTSVQLAKKVKVNELIQKYLIRRKFKILCWYKNNDYGILIGFKKDNVLYSVLIAEKDFLFGIHTRPKHQVDSRYFPRIN